MQQQIRRDQPMEVAIKVKSYQRLIYDRTFLQRSSYNLIRQYLVVVILLPLFLFTNSFISPIMMVGQPQQQPIVNVGGDKLPKIVVCTRIHLGKASVPPTDEFLTSLLSSFASLVYSSRALKGAIAVDSQPKIDGYDLPSHIRTLLSDILLQWSQNGDTVVVDVIPVTPWGQFIPALNALVRWASLARASHILFVSAEISTLTYDGIQLLLQHFDDDKTLVVGAVLPGHQYNKAQSRVPLTGLTTPWNTAAMWNVSKLALTGFPLVAEGILTDQEGCPVAAGIEEVSTIYILQKLLPSGTAEAKLIPIPGIHWDTQFHGDKSRRQWHESKMQSKMQRAAKHMELLLGFKDNSNSIVASNTVLHL